MSLITISMLRSNRLDHTNRCIGIAISLEALLQKILKIPTDQRTLQGPILMPKLLQSGEELSKNIAMARHYIVSTPTGSLDFDSSWSKRTPKVSLPTDQLGTWTLVLVLFVKITLPEFIRQLRYLIDNAELQCHHYLLQHVSLFRKIQLTLLSLLWVTTPHPWWELHLLEAYHLDYFFNCTQRSFVSSPLSHLFSFPLSPLFSSVSSPLFCHLLCFPGNYFWMKFVEITPLWSRESYWWLLFGMWGNLGRMNIFIYCSKTEISSGLKRQDNSAITLESFLGILTPLLYRNEEIFLSVFKAHLRVFEHGRVLMVGLKDVLISLPLFLD